MIFKQGKVKHFTGIEGVYYHIPNDEIWVLTKAEMSMVYNQKSGCVETYDRFDVETLGFKKDCVVVVDHPKTLFYLGEP